jgi:hypothetical protein
MSPLDTPEGRIGILGGRTEIPLNGINGQPAEKEEMNKVECIGLTPTGAAKIPPRPWAYGNFLLFGQAAALGGVDGSGKGSMAVSMALAMISGRPLLGERIWQPGPVVIVSYEDDGEEWHRRVAAACKYHSVN